MPVKLKSIDIDGRVLDVFVDPSTGIFRVELGDDSLSAATLEEVIARARKQLRQSKVRLSVKATLLLGDRDRLRGASKTYFRQITITGLHGRSGNVLVRYDDTGKSDQLGGYSGDGLARRLSDAEAKHYTELVQARNSAVAALEKFESSVKLGGRRDVTELIEQWIAEKIDTPEQPEEPTGDPRIDGKRRTRKRVRR